MKVHTQQFNYDSELDPFIDRVGAAGGYVCGVLRVPFWNAWRQPVSTAWCVVYQAEAPIEVEVLC